MTRVKRGMLLVNAAKILTSRFRGSHSTLTANQQVMKALRVPTAIAKKRDFRRL